MKSDVLDGFHTIKACTAYEIDGKVTDRFPFAIDSDKVKPVYKELPGWETPMSSMTSEKEFPEAFNNYVAFLEKELGTPIVIVSVGPDRIQTIER